MLLYFTPSSCTCSLNLGLNHILIACAQLKGEYGKKVVKGFPPKKFLHNLSPASIDRRHQQLQDWLQSILNDKVMVSATALQLFIKAGKEDADFVPRQLASTIESDIDMATTLYKYSGGKWKDRWFVLRHGRLYKYNSPQNKHPYGFYDLRSARAAALSDVPDLHIKNAKNYAFVVDSMNVNPEEKPTRYIFSATTDDIMKGWISCINQEFAKTEHNKVFGVPISEVRDRDENGVPLFLSALLTFLEATALKEEDLFTKPPDEEIKRAIDRGKTVDIAKVAEDAHAVAGLIVQYLHELPDAIIPEDMCPAFYGIFEIKNKEKRLRMLAAFSEILPIINRNLLIKVFSFLHHASQGAVKRERLSKIFGRIIFRVAGDHQINISGIAEQLMDHWDTLVVADEVYAAPEKILVVKKKKGRKSSSKSTKKADKERKAGKDGKDVKDGKDGKPVHNDYYDSNEEAEESSEEEEWTDDEVQVISEISEYSNEEDEGESDVSEEYGDEELIDELKKAAADIPEIGGATSSSASVSVPMTPEKPIKKDGEEISGEPLALAKKKAEEEASAAAAVREAEAAAKEKAEKEKAEKKAQRKAEKAATEAAESAVAAASVPTPTAEHVSEPAAEPVSTTTTTEGPAKSEKKHKKEQSTLEKVEEPTSTAAAAAAAATESPASIKKKSKREVTKTAATTDSSIASTASAVAEVTSSAASTETSTTATTESSEEPSQQASTNTNAAAEESDESEDDETAATAAKPKRTKRSKSTKKAQRELSRRPAGVETIAGVQTGNPPATSDSDAAHATGAPILPPPLSLEGIPMEEQPLGSPTHAPLMSPNVRRPKKNMSQIPTSARSPHVPPQKAPEPARTPQEQLVADLGRVLGRRPVGGVALFPMPVKK